MKLTLPVDSAVRKTIQLFRGCINYFPAALAGVARWSKVGNDKHNPGQILHHSRGKSNDHVECVQRHLMDTADILAHIERNRDDMEQPEFDETIAALFDELDAGCWRMLALSQELHEKYGGAPLAPAAVAAET